MSYKHIVVFLLIGCTAAFAQDSLLLYDADYPSKEFHQGRREALRKLMPGNSVAVVFTAPVRNRWHDVDFQYHQAPDFFYLTGLLEPDGLLLIFKENQSVDSLQVKELLFVRPRNTAAESWTGKRLGVVGTKEKTGIPATYANAEFSGIKLDFTKFSTVIWPELYEDIRNEHGTGDLYDLVKQLREKTKLRKPVDSLRLDDFMAALREVKMPEEIQLLRKAIEISCDGHRETIKALETDMTEYQAQAMAEYLFKKGGAEYVGYPSIVGGGGNSCILHYTSNRKKLISKDLLLMDMGAEYHGYTADITRTLPVKGVFSEEQRIIYSIVLEAQLAGINAARKDSAFKAPHYAAMAVIKKRLKEMGIIKNEEEARRYFFHGTSHYLGLDVHDPGTYGLLKPGSVITVEPGIYIEKGAPCDPKWWDIGVRIEDDVLITEGTPDVLSDCAPKAILEIEQLMKETSFFNKAGEEH